MFFGWKYVFTKVLLAMFTIVTGVSLVKVLAWAGIILFVISLILLWQLASAVGRGLKRLFS